MQNQYFGDVGDFAKYGLLRAVERAGLSVGVHWYLVPDGIGNANDGRHVGYLRDAPRHRALDPELFEAMRAAVDAERRTVEVIEQSSLLRGPYYSAPLDFYHAPPKARVGRRQAWHHAALAQLAGTDLVFVDPDNGLEAKAVRPSSAVACKYVFHDELLDYWRRGQSLVVYHHLGRSGGTHAAQLCARRDMLCELLTGASVAGLLCRRGTPRVFFVVSTPQHATQLHRMVDELVSSAWATGTPARRMFEPDAHWRTP